MSVIGSPIDTSLLQTAQAQQAASKARDKEKAESDRPRRDRDRVELRVSGLETIAAVRKLPQTSSEESDVERDGREQGSPPSARSGDEEERPGIDVQA